MVVNLSEEVFSKRAKEFCAFRATVMNLLYSTKPDEDKRNQILNDFVNSFSRFAGNQRTAFDEGASRTYANGGNPLELKVERAFTQVLGRALGRGGSSNFINALNGAFPTAPDGQVIYTPQRGVVSLYSPNGNMPVGSSAYGNYSSDINPYNNSVLGSLVGQLSTKQATLYREANVVAGDALRILASLQPFLPQADTQEVEALRSLVQSTINALVEEFGRVDEPREARVESYLNALDVNITEFGRRGILDKPKLVTTVDDEAQTAGFVLLKNYVSILRSIWNTYNGSERPTTTFSLSERVERATILLPIIAQGNVDLQAALDSVAFTESEQRSRAAKFTTLNGFKVNTFDLFYPSSETVVCFSEDTSSQLLFQRVFNIGKQLPDMTVRDLVEWLDRFSNIEGPTILADSGQFGLDFVLNEADTLFWTIVPIVRIIQTTDTIASTSRLMLRQVLSNERVRWAFDNLLEQLKALADLACTDEDVQPLL